MKMHRRELIADLSDYAARFPDEAVTAARFLEFVRRHSDCFRRDCLPGHVTASAWIVDRTGMRVLLSHHKKLGKWLQPGGHSDGEADGLAVALREAREESGLELVASGRKLLDIDIHEIPAWRAEPPHLHYDLRYALAARSDSYRVSAESHDLAWAPFDSLETYTREESILRMRRKWLAGRRVNLARVAQAVANRAADQKSSVSP